MKMQSILVSLTCAALFVSTTVRADEPVDALKTEKERISYTVGVESARNFKKQGFEFDAQMFLRGMDDGMSGQKTLIPEREMKKILQAFQVKVRQSMAANRKAAADENRRKSTEFLEANKSKDGIVALTSGLQYKVLKDGNGRKPTEADIVLCEYRGTLLDGTEFDGTTPGKPATMKLSQLIPGWKEALKLMPVGSKWQLFVPPSMAYGEKGVGTEIGPNELLVFELELVDIK
jgi:FKBP-type peptidyl-prolyl cis-trans isomerase FklB